MDILRTNVYETFADISWTCSETLGHGRADLPVKTTGGTQGRRGTGPVAGKHAFSKRVPQLQSFQRQSGEKQHSRCPLNRREAPKPFSQQRARQWRSTGVCGFALARRLVELSQTREQGIESPLNPFSSCDRARQHPFQNHVILQARYTHSSHNGMIDLAGASCWGFRNARSVQETDTAGSPSFSCAGPCALVLAVCRSQTN
jgi:hypothetical protein